MKVSKEILNILMELVYLEEKYDIAEGMITQFYKYRPKIVTLELYLFDIYLNTGRHKKAYDKIIEIQQDFPGKVDFKMRELNFYCIFGYKKRFQNKLHEAIALYPDSSQLKWIWWMENRIHKAVLTEKDFDTLDMPTTKYKYRTAYNIVRAKQEMQNKNYKIAFILLYNLMEKINGFYYTNHIIDLLLQCSIALEQKTKVKNRFIMKSMHFGNYHALLQTQIVPEETLADSELVKRKYFLNYKQIQMKIKVECLR